MKDVCPRELRDKNNIGFKRPELQTNRQPQFFFDDFYFLFTVYSNKLGDQHLKVNNSADFFKKIFIGAQK